jgi:hypothetical protein
MTAIQTEVAKRIAVLAASINAEYALRIGEETLGTLPVLPPANSSKPVKFHSPKLYNFVRDTGYNKALAVLPPGGVYSHSVPSGAYARGFEATLKAYARAHWGRDSHVLASTDTGSATTVELLRVL